MTHGGTTILDWAVPNVNSTSSTLTAVPWSLSLDSINFKGNTLSAWKVSHDGELLGWWHCAIKPNPRGRCPSGDVYSEGTATETDYFDSLYGIRLSYSISGNFLLARGGGESGWTETMSNTAQITDTNISFPSHTTISVPGNFTMIVDGTAYKGKKTFNWVLGSTHTVTINESIQESPGVRYVFLKWSDGSNDTSRTIKASSTSKTYSARVKTQYELLVVSDLGNPNGTGWYDKGTNATFSVDSSQPEPGLLGFLGGKFAFQSWAGDSNATTIASKILMNGPKTVQATWVAQNSQAYTYIGGVAVAIIAIALAVTVSTRRKQSRIQPSQSIGS
jgi:hypothetical protein